MTGSPAPLRIDAVLLAAGASRRFEAGDKLLAEIAGRAVIGWAAAALPRDLVRSVVAVTGPGDRARRAALAAFGVEHVVNADADAGQGRSVALGIRALRSDCDGALVLPADMPALSSGLVARLIAAFAARNGEAIVFAQIEGAQRPPVLWPRALFGELAALEGPGGGKPLIARHVERAAPLALTPADAAQLEDVDTADDLVRLAALIATRR